MPTWSDRPWPECTGPGSSFAVVRRCPSQSEMRRLRLTLDGPTHADGDAYDDGALPDLTSGLMWLVTALVGMAVQVLPGTDHSHMAWVVGLAAFAFAWGVTSIVLGTCGLVMSLRLRALVTAAMMPVVALALWATGGATSYLQPVLLFTALFVAWFFPPPLAWPLVGLFVFAYASPLTYDPDAVSLGYPARAVVFAVAVAGLAVTMQYLKRRLVHAEVRQRAITKLDPLTEVSNRRGFDLALARAHEQEERHALVLFDLDHFKAINDA